MIFIAWFILFFTILQLLVAFINLISRPKLKDLPSAYEGLVSVLIPVRNEDDRARPVQLVRASRRVSLCRTSVLRTPPR